MQNKKNKRIEEDEAIEHFKELLNGFKGFHEHNFIHRDLKFENIMVNNDVFKIGDMGLGKILQDENAQTQTILGTTITMAPEVLEG